MTLLTDVGREWYGDKSINNVTTRLDAVAIGSGSGSEDIAATSLGTEEYRANYQDTNVTFSEVGSTGEVEVTIEITGGTEVPGGTTITEMAIFAGGQGGGGVMVWVDEFGDVTIGVGDVRSFTMEYQHNR